jgi:hypothetical protein
MSSLESLLRATHLRHGRICLYVADGRWNGSVSHFHGHMAWEDGQGHSDPADAFRAALIEDERKSRDQVRKYDAAPKHSAATPMPPAQIDLEEAIAAVAAPVDIDGLLG